MSEHLDASQARAREAHHRLAEATAAHAAELKRIREETRRRVAPAEVRGRCPSFFYDASAGLVTPSHSARRWGR